MTSRTCYNCGSTNVKYVFKAHAPTAEGSAEYCESVNLWLCSDCAAPPALEMAGNESATPSHLIERYIRVHFEPMKTGRLLDEPLKQWHLAYGLLDTWVFFEPRAKIYWTASRLGE